MEDIDQKNMKLYPFSNGTFQAESIANRENNEKRKSERNLLEQTPLNI